ncbi:MAG TPA: Do family serine endopeptidase [Deltaproteobacteria bacterium]|nr:Do family serine endopeptidase [Deltaproteobacteria bacterium]
MARFLTGKNTPTLMVLLIAVCMIAACTKQSAPPPQPKPNIAPEAPSPGIAPLKAKPVYSTDFRTAIIQVARYAIPAVVHIEVTQREVVANPLAPMESDPFFRFFFGNPRAPRKFKRELKGLGTGMIIDTNGHILTNNHVVAGATEIEVQLSSGRKYPAVLVGADPKTDLAVIKIEPKEKLPTVTFGNSDRMEVGEWVVAIGHPRGLDQTVTQGIISAKHRQGITDPSSYQDFLQTDAPINPGNSGGPLLNLSGQVIGVNAVIASESGGFEGIGFAIPSNIAVHVSNGLISKGKVDRGWVGVTVQDLTPEIAQSLGLDLPQGALIADVSKNGPAEKAGLKPGDVVLSLNGKDIRDGGALRNTVANTPIGTLIKLTIWRDKREQEITVMVGNLDDAFKAITDALRERLGATFRPLKPAEASNLGIDPSVGVVVGRLDAKGPLARVGFEVGDVVLGVNGQQIDSVETLAALIDSLPHNHRVSLFAMDHNSRRAGNVVIEVR